MNYFVRTSTWKYLYASNHSISSDKGCQLNKETMQLCSDILSMNTEVCAQSIQHVEENMMSEKGRTAS